MARTDSTIAEVKSDVSTAELQAQIQTLKNDIAELTATVARYGRAQTEALKAQARTGLRTVAERGQEQMTAAQELAAAKYAETEDYVRAHPATSVGIAAGAGFLVGLLASRR